MMGVQVLIQVEMLPGETGVDGVWGDGKSMSRERCSELRQWYPGQMDGERETEGEEVSAQLQGMA